MSMRYCPKAAPAVSMSLGSISGVDTCKHAWRHVTFELTTTEHDGAQKRSPRASLCV